MEYGYLLSICLILVSTKLLSMLSGKLQLPQVVGALIAGLLLGPAVFGVVAPSELLSQLAEIGVIIIMFCAGLEVNIKDLKESGKSSFIIALLGVLVPLVMGAGLMFFFNDDGNILENIFMGTILTATSVSITVETLKEMGKLSTKVGNTLLAAALIDDILGLICLTIVTSLGGDSVNIGLVLLKIVLFFVAIGVIWFVFNKLCAVYFAKKGNGDLHRYTIAAFALCLLMAWMGEEIFGVADIIGAFAAGLMVASTPKRHYVNTKISPLSYLLLTPIFFANIGIGITLPKMTPSLILFSVLLIIVAISSKLIGCGLGALVDGFNAKQATQIGIGMANRGEVALIVANKGLVLGVLSEEFLSPVVILIIVCAIIGPILLKLSFKGEEKHHGLQESSLVDNYQLAGQMDIVTDQLLTRETKNSKGK